MLDRQADARAGTVLLNELRLGLFVAIIAGLGLCFLILFATPAYAWTSDNSGKAYTLMSIHDEVGNDTVVEPIAPDVYVVKQDIIIQTNDKLFLQDNLTYMNVGCQYTIYGTLSVHYSTIKQNVTGWTGIVAYSGATIDIGYSSIENATTGLRMGSATVSIIDISDTTFKFCTNGMTLSPTSASAIGISVDYCNFANCTNGFVVNQNVPNVGLLGCRFAGNSVAVTINGMTAIPNFDPIFDNNTNALKTTNGGRMNIYAIGAASIIRGNAVMDGSIYVSAGAKMLLLSTNLTINGSFIVDPSGASLVTFENCNVGFNCTSGGKEIIFVDMGTFAGAMLSIRSSRFYIASGASYYIFSICNANVDIRDTSFEDRAPSKIFQIQTSAAGQVVSFENITIKSSDIGIIISSSTGSFLDALVVLRNSTFESCSIAVEVVYMNALITNNRINNTVAGINAERANVNINNNTITNQSTGVSEAAITLRQDVSGLIADNTIASSQCGIGFEQGVPYASWAVVVERNAISGSAIGKSGIFFQDMNPISIGGIRNNTITGFNVGINAGGSHPNIYENNYITNCEVGIMLGNQQAGIMGGKISNSLCGIMLEQQTTTYIFDVEIEGCVYGICNQFSTNTLIIGGYVHDCRLGLWDMHDASLATNYPSIAFECRFENNGIGIKAGNLQTIAIDCEFVNNEIGLDQSLGVAVASDNGTSRTIALGFSIHDLDYASMDVVLSSCRAYLGGSNSVFFVDDDRGTNSDVDVVNELYALGCAVSYWDVSMYGLPNAAQLASCGWVVWHTGDYGMPDSLEPLRVAVMTEYLNMNGANMLLTGRNIPSSLSDNQANLEFGISYLHAVPQWSISATAAPTAIGLACEGAFSSINGIPMSVDYFAIAPSDGSARTVIQSNFSVAQAAIYSGGNFTGNDIAVMCSPGLGANRIFLSGNFTNNRLGFSSYPWVPTLLYVQTITTVINTDIDVSLFGIAAGGRARLFGANISAINIGIGANGSFEASDCNVSFTNFFADANVYANFTGVTVLINSTDADLGEFVFSTGCIIRFENLGARRTVVTSDNPDGSHNFIFDVGALSSFRFVNSDLSNCGLDNSIPENIGLHLMTMNFFFEGATFANNTCGIFVSDIYATDYAMGYIDSSTFTNNDYGIYYDSIDHSAVYISDCAFSSNNYGMYIIQADSYIYVYDTNFTEDQEGIYIYNSNVNLIRTAFYDNERGISIMSSYYTYFEDCNFTNNDYGIEGSSIYYSSMIDCNFIDNYYGVNAQSSMFYVYYYEDCTISRSNMTWSAAIYATADVTIEYSDLHFSANWDDNALNFVGSLTATNVSFDGLGGYYAWFITIGSTATFTDCTFANAGRGGNALSENGVAIMGLGIFMRCVFEYCDYGIVGMNGTIVLEDVEILYSDEGGIYAEYSAINFEGASPSEIHDNPVGMRLKGSSVSSEGVNIYLNDVGIDMLEQNIYMSASNKIHVANNDIGIRIAGGSLTIDGGEPLEQNARTIEAQSCLLNIRNEVINYTSSAIYASNAICYVYNCTIAEVVYGDAITLAATQGGIFSTNIAGSTGASLAITAYSCSPLITDCDISHFTVAMQLVNSYAPITRTNIADCVVAYSIYSSNPQFSVCTIASTQYFGFAQSSEIKMDRASVTTAYGMNMTYATLFSASNSTFAHTFGFVLDVDSHATLLNSSYTGAMTMTTTINDDYSTFERKWFAHVRVVDALGGPLGGMQVLARDGNMQNAFGTITGGNGVSYWNVCTGELITRMGRDTTMAKHNFTTSMGGTFAYAEAMMNVSRTITLTYNPAPVIISPIPDVHVFEDCGTNITCVRLAEHFSDLGALSFYFTSSVANITVDESSGFLRVTTNTPNWYGNALATVRATDNLGAFVECQFNVIVEPVNDAPYISTIADITAIEDVPYVLDMTPYLNDVDTHISMLTLTVNSSYVSVSGHILTFEYPNGILYDLVEVTVFDGALASTQTIVVNVTPVNDAPTILPIPAQFVFEDSEGIIMYDQYVFDVDNPIDSLILSTDSIYFTVEAAELELEFTYPNGITYQKVKLTASDGLAYSETYIDVYITPVNDPPILAPIPQINVTEDVPFTLDLAPYMFDIDNHIWELTLYDDSQYTTISGHFITFVYPNGISNDVLNLTLFDGEFACSQLVNVSITAVNDAPTIIGVPAFQAIEDVPYVLNLTPYIADVDNATEELMISTNSAFAIVENQTLTFTYTEGVTSEIVQISVSDGLLSSTIELLVNVLPVNDAPTLPSSISVNAIEDVTYHLDLSAMVTDVDTPAAQLKLYADSPYAVVLGMRLALTYPNGVAYETFNITVSDGFSSASARVTATVLATNDAPVLAPLPDLVLREDVPYAFDLAPYMSDVDNALSTLSISSVSSSYASVSGTTITFTYPNGVTYDVVRVTITDGNATAQRDVRITIEPVNDAPVIGEITGITAIEDVELAINLSSYISDVDNLLSELTVTCNSPYARILGMMLYLKYPNGVTTDTLMLVVCDGKLSSERAVAVSIIPVNDAPLLTDAKAIPPANADTTQNYVFSVVYTDEENQAPKSVVVYIDGESFALEEADSGDTKFDDGKAYSVEVKLGKGAHTYRFETEDGGNGSTLVTTPAASLNVAGENTQISKLASASTGNFYATTALLIIIAALCAIILLLLLKQMRAPPTVVVSTKQEQYMPKDTQPKPEELPKHGSEPVSPDILDERLRKREAELGVDTRGARLEGKSGSAEIDGTMSFTSDGPNNMR